MSVPIHVIAGFLGSGKTTTLLALLRQRPLDERVSIIVNDFGEASVDATVLAERNAAIAEIPGACVCCTAPEGFAGALRDQLETQPDRIFVEPTGLARPADLVDTIRRQPYADQVDVRPVIVLVDPHQLEPDKVALLPVLREQAEVADILVANRIDLASDAERSRFRDWASTLWPAPIEVIETQHGALPERVLDPAPRRALPPHDHDHDHHDFSARSWIWPADVRFSKERLGDALARLATQLPLVRFKGLFHTDEGVFYLEVAGDRVHERLTAYRRDSRVDVLLSGGHQPFDTVDTWLSEAVLTEAERTLPSTLIDVSLPDGRRAQFGRDALRALPDGIDDVSTLLPKRQGAAARLAALLAALDVADDAELVVVASDGYATPAVRVSDLQTAVILHSLDDQPLPADKGGPFRLLIPGDAGPGGPCANVKGVVRLTLR